ncbi:hypothetical protein F4777DRAFT_526870 [Nemania sp. FL0916]|nr:hypothetical protein F4777DRAFT_526870 [Nemania sp. FL0916]
MKTGRTFILIYLVHHRTPALSVNWHRLVSLPIRGPGRIITAPGDSVIIIIPLYPRYQTKPAHPWCRWGLDLTPNPLLYLLHS